MAVRDGAHENELDRRGFLGRLGGASAGLLCSGVLLGLQGCATVRYAQYTRSGRRLVIPLSEFGEDPHLFLENPTDARPIYLRRSGGEEFTAVSTRCTHRGCQIELQGDRLVCPCHGSRYTLEGTVVEGPAERDLTEYEVSSDGERVFVTLPSSGGI